MKVLFLTKDEKTSSTRIRILNLLPFLKNANIDVTSEPIEKNRLKRLLQFIRSKRYDVVVLQKKLMPLFFIRLLRHFSKKLLYDFDDALYFQVESWNVKDNKYQHPKRERRFVNTVLSCDGIIAANNTLRKKIISIKQELKTFIIPSAVETDGFSLKKEFKISNRPVLAWIGTSNSQHYFNYILPALQNVYKEKPFILNIISDKPVNLQGIDVKFSPWHVQGQYEELKKCDIGIMPLSPDPFSKGKSSYKLLQYMSCQVPSLCSAVGMNRDVSNHDQYCLEAETNDEFSEKLLLLLRDENLRRSLALKGRNLVIEKFSQKIVATQLIEALRDITSTPKQN